MTEQLDSDALADHGCTSDVIQIIEQIEGRAAACSMILDDSSLPELTLWTLLRWERKVALVALERLGVDLKTLETTLYMLLCAKFEGFLSKTEILPGVCGHVADYSNAITHLVNVAKTEACRMKCQYIGTEHLLLAILTLSDAYFTTLIAGYGITTGKLKKAILKTLTESNIGKDRPV